MAHDINYIVFISSMVVYIPIIIGIISLLKKKFTGELTIIYVFLLFCGLMQAVQNQFYADWRNYIDGNSLWLHHIFMPLQFIILTILYNTFLKKIKFFNSFSSFVFVAVILDCFVFTDFSEYPIFSMVLSALYFTVLPAVYMVNHFLDYKKHEEISDRKFVFNYKMLLFSFGLLANSAFGAVLVLYSTLIGEFYLANELSAISDALKHLIFITVFI